MNPVRRSAAALAAAAALALPSCMFFDPTPPPDNTIALLRDNKAVPIVAPTVAPTGPLDISLSDAMLLCLENNPSVRVERLNPPISRTFEEQERAVFDTIVSADLNASTARTPGGSTSSIGGGVALDRAFPGGTALHGETTTAHTTGGKPLFTSRTGASVSQALLRGADVDASLAALRQSVLDSRSSEYELRGFIQTLLANLEDAYWNCALARQQIDIFQKSLDVAERQLKETNQRIQVGVLPETERAAAEAEVALRRQDLITARARAETTRLALIQLISPPGAARWTRPLTLRDVIAAPAVQADDVESHVAFAESRRPEINQALLAIRRGELEIVRTKNGVLPRLDAFISLGKTGYSGSFGNSIENEVSGRRFDASVGLAFQYPIGNRDPRARYDRARLSSEQAAESLTNLRQLVQVDVRSAHVNVMSSFEQIAATAATRKLQEEKVRAETEKFKAGKSTSLLVAQAERDLLGSQIAEIQTVVDHRKALTALFRLDGSLLERRGIAAPGGKPVE